MVLLVAHWYFHTLLFSTCASGYKQKKVEKWQVKNPGPIFQKVAISKQTKKSKKHKKAPEKSN